MSDIENSELIQAPYKTASLLSHQYFHTLRNILDKHAPEHECKTPQHVNKGFINSEILAAKRRKRKLEREWRKDNSAINRSRYRAAVNHFNRLVECAKTKHYSDMVRENEDNPKALWNSIKKVLHRSPKMVLPDYITMNSLVNTFGRYFADKIAKLRSGLLSTDADPPVSGSYKNKFVSFRTMSEEEVLKIIKSTPNKSCDLDPIPTSLVLECISVLLTLITNIVNYSLQEGSFPSCFKTAHVTPLLKKAGLDKNILKNYRPVSNLSYISKLIEKAVAKQINEHIAHEGISNKNKSAYRAFHSTETALLKIQNDIATSMDKGAAVGLVRLDLSAAFDTIDHSILFNCLQHWYGIDGVVLKWVQSYLNSRKQRIKIDGHLSHAFQLPYGVPQGSVLGPLLFTLYTTPLSSVISKFNVTHHLYADDTQICLELDSRNFDSSITELTNCLEAVQAWMGINKLKLNPDKTEFIVIGDDQIRSSLKSSFPVSLLGNTMEPAESVKNLGVILDAKNSMQRHVANLCCISYYHLRELRRVRRYLNHETAVEVANALVSSRLDYCNSLLYNTKKAYTSRLQRVQNALCRTVCKLNKYCHVTPFLHKLHWLPIQYRILFKYNLLIYKAIHLSQPPYLSALIRRSDLTRGNRLSISSSKPNKRSGLCSFIAGAPTEWNKLPQAIRTIESISGFRKQLKTYLFRLAYPPP